MRIPLRAADLSALLTMLLLTAPANTGFGQSPAGAASAPADVGRMLVGDWVPQHTQKIDFDTLPRVPSQHAMVSDVRAQDSFANKLDKTKLDKTRGGVNQHNYLVRHDGKFWIMWSDGPGIEDRVGQRVKFATSADGLLWSAPRFLTPEPPQSGPNSPCYGKRSDQGFRYIARGFWKRESDLFALASLDEAAGFFGPSLELRAFRLSAAGQLWEDAGVIYKDAINNFPPRKLPSGQWLLSRRAHDYRQSGVHFLIGGVEAIDQWESFPVLGSNSELATEEPDWWILPDNRLVAVFRDNRGGGFLYCSLSADGGRTWTAPVQTNFPDATSKFCGLRLADGRYVLVSNPAPKKRDPLTVSLSNDGLHFHKMTYLVGGRWVDYPHVIEHEKELLIAFSGGKQTVEVLKLRLADLDAVHMSPRRPSRPDSSP